MHRSGTSALCGVLHQLGAERPLRELPPQPDNEKGFFEPSEIVAIHDRLLESAGLTWFDWDPLPASWHASPLREAFVDELVGAAAQDFPGGGPLLVKDPRACRFADVWLAVIERIYAKPMVILQYRHPAEVALSLRARNGFPTGHGFLLWLRHVIDAERATRSVERSFVSFAHLMEDWYGELAPTLADDRLNLAKVSARAMAMAGDFLDPALRHQQGSSRTPLHCWAEEAFQALQRLRDDPRDLVALATLDAVGNAFDTACAAFAPAFHQVSLHLSHSEKVKEQLSKIKAALAASQEVITAWTPLVERLHVLEGEHDSALRALAGAQAEAERLSGVETTLAESLANRDALRSEAEQMHLVQADLVSARQRIADLERELDDVRVADRTQSTASIPQVASEPALI